MLPQTTPTLRLGPPPRRHAPNNPHRVPNFVSRVLHVSRVMRKGVRGRTALCHRLATAAGSWVTTLGPECSQRSDQRQAGATLGGRRVVSGVVGSPCLLRYRIPSGTPGRCAASQGSPDVRGVSRTTRGHEIPVPLCHFDHADALSLVCTCHGEFVSHKKIVAFRLG